MRLRLAKRHREEFVLLARAIKVLGPRNYTALAKFTGLPVETVRYRVKHLLAKAGVRIQAHVDHGKLGLARYWLRLRFADGLDGLSVRFLEQLVVSGCLEHYGRLLPGGDYIAGLGLPPRFERSYRIMLDRLVDMGVLEGYSMHKVSWIRYLSMREDCYDFARGVWSFAWDGLHGRAPEDVSIEEDVLSKPRLDELDLQITAWLQVDALTPISEIARRLGVGYKRVLYHYREHVLKRGIIKRYILRWQGRAGRGNLAYMLVIVRDVSGRELEEVKRTFQRIPFTFFDTYVAGERLYIAYVILPVSYLQGCLSYIWRSLPPVRSRVVTELIDTGCSRAFAIPLELYSDIEGWTFSVSSNLRKLFKLLKVSEKIGGTW